MGRKGNRTGGSSGESKKRGQAGGGRQAIKGENIKWL